jgi:uncharacterized protein
MRRGWSGILLMVAAVGPGVQAAWGQGAAPNQGAAPGPAQVQGTVDYSGQWKAHIADWRAARAKDLTAPDGWLSLVGLEWLKSGANSFGTAGDNSLKIAAQGPDPAPAHFGLITVSGTTVQLLALPEGFPPGFAVNGKPAQEGQLSTDGDNPATMTWHGLTMVILERGGRYALRIKDANAPTRTGFKGLNWYAPDLKFAVEAKWIPYNPPRIEKIPTIIGTTLNLPAPGVAEFTLNGQTLRLEPVLEDPHDTTLFFILRDETSKTTTYEAARFLRTAFPDHGLDKPGKLILDFNQLYNPPCAYTQFATCPLPPPGNRLAIAIEAGEERYEH